jgi:hypothetical protein
MVSRAHAGAGIDGLAATFPQGPAEAVCGRFPTASPDAAEADLSRERQDCGLRVVLFFAVTGVSRVPTGDGSFGSVHPPTAVPEGKHPMKRTSSMLVAAAASVGLVMAAPAASAQPNRANQEGLVNLALQDTNVQIPIGIAANVCGVAVNVLARAENLGDIECTAEGISLAENEGNGNNRARQNGLVNVAVQGTNVQVPVSVAANVCGLAVNVLAQQDLTGEITCESVGGAEALN